MGTFMLVQRPANYNPLPLHFVYKLKRRRGQGAVCGGPWINHTKWQGLATQEGPVLQQQQLSSLSRKSLPDSASGDFSRRLRTRRSSATSESDCAKGKEIILLSYYVEDSACTINSDALYKKS